jgi:hypothetical protein
MQKLLQFKNYKVLLSITLLTTILFYACTKIDTRQNEVEIADNKNEVTNRFFETPASTSTTILKIVNEIKNRNAKNEFVTNFAENNGYPVWDKAILKTKKRESGNTSFANTVGINDTFALIPFVLLDSNFVNGYIFANINDSINLSYSLAKDYKAYPFTLNPNIENANKFALRILLLNKSVFGNTEFQILDKRLFSADTIHNKTTKIILREQGQQTNVQEYEVCVPITILGWYCGTPTNPACMPSCDYCGNQCHVTMQDATECTDLYPPSGGGGGPTGGGGAPTSGGGGGGIPYDPPPCNPNPTNPSVVASNVVPGDPLPPCPVGGGVGWVPIPPHLNPLVASSIILDTSITNNFPCVQRIIDSLSNFMSINAIAQKALHDVFNINKKIHTTLKIGWALTKDSADGETNEDYLLNNNSSNNFYATIRLNPWMLRNSTQEYIAATIIHEAFHSYIDYKYYQYRYNIIDSNQYKMLFPLYWPPRTGSYILNASQNRQHKIMAANLIEIMAAPLSSVNSNPYITTMLRDSINKALTWGGLQETTVWRTKSDTNDIRAINTFARDTSVTAPFRLSAGGLPYGSIYTIDSHTLHMKKGCQ